MQKTPATHLLFTLRAIDHTDLIPLSPPCWTVPSLNSPDCWFWNIQTVLMDCDLDFYVYMSLWITSDFGLSLGHISGILFRTCFSRSRVSKPQLWPWISNLNHHDVSKVSRVKTRTARQRWYCGRSSPSQLRIRSKGCRQPSFWTSGLKLDRSCLDTAGLESEISAHILPTFVLHTTNEAQGFWETMYRVYFKNPTKCPC